LNAIFRIEQIDGIHTYQIKGNAMQSLGVNVADEDNKIAEFETKANLQDITDPLNPISLGGNLRLHVDMTDKGEPGTDDSISFFLTTNNGILLYSSNWDGLETNEMLLSGGNIVVHSGYSAAPLLLKGDEDVLIEALELYPNPANDIVYLRVPSGVTVSAVKVYDLSGRLIQEVVKSDQGTEIPINVSTLQSSSYVFVIEGPFGQVVKHVVKE